jgi:osmotically-inducible protein OsmY
MHSQTDPVRGSVGATDEDRRLWSEVSRAFERHPYLARSTVHFEVDAGKVHIYGVATNRLVKQAAWDAAWSIRSVQDVFIDLPVVDASEP